MPINEKIKTILSCSIEQDQLAVATQWAKTFLYNPMDDIATQMAKLLLACVAKGDFKTRPCFSPETDPLEYPYDGLTIADYLSHGSRIIVDYQGLSEKNRQQFLRYFSVGISRAATHCVTREANNTIKECKGKLIGARGQLSAEIVTPRDFGINIAMGGQGQINFAGKEISADGCNGHFYFHHNNDNFLLMAGLEQTEPPSIYKALLGSKSDIKSDQFNQTHSWVGHSDTYTAAGSLYFSNPIYQAKFFLEKSYFPPDKYGAMQVTITDDNWPEIINFFKSLRPTSSETLIESEKNLITCLSKKPSTARDNNTNDYSDGVEIDFKTYLTQLHKVFIKNNEYVDKIGIKAQQETLLDNITALKTGRANSSEPLFTALRNLMEESPIPLEYKNAIIRIDSLFTLKLHQTPNLPWSPSPVQEKNKVADLGSQALDYCNRFMSYFWQTEATEQTEQTDDVDNKAEFNKAEKNCSPCS